MLPETNVAGGEIIDDLPQIESAADTIRDVKAYDPASTRIQLGLKYENIWQEQLLK